MSWCWFFFYLGFLGTLWCVFLFLATGVEDNSERRSQRTWRRFHFSFGTPTKVWKVDGPWLVSARPTVCSVRAHHRLTFPFSFPYSTSSSSSFVVVAAVAAAAVASSYFIFCNLLSSSLFAFNESSFYHIFRSVSLHSPWWQTYQSSIRKQKNPVKPSKILRVSPLPKIFASFNSRVPQFTGSCSRNQSCET